jgi:hypothetical protein
MRRFYVPPREAPCRSALAGYRDLEVYDIEYD